jgi:CheY-like chemotaxis protein
VLLAEDNAINTMLATTILHAAGYEVECVVNGAEAVEAAGRSDFDLILMDMQMPIMDGLQATRLIRQLAAPANAVPIVAMTANAMRKDQDACMAAGMNDFISKPIDAEAFLGVVGRFMGAELWDDDSAEPEAPTQLLEVDETKLDALARILPPERLLKIIDTYLDDTRGRMDHIEVLLETMDFPSTAREAHDLKAASGSFGAQRVQALAAQLERACQCCDDAEAPRLVVEIRKASVTAAEGVDGWVARWRAGEAA